MLQRVKDIIGAKVVAHNGDVGHIEDIHFDDRTWAVRYFVVQTGTWLSQQEVLLAPAAVQLCVDRELKFTTQLTREQVKDSPPMASDLPISHQYEDRLHTHYGWVPYWNVPLYSGIGVYAYPTHAGAGYFPYDDRAAEPEVRAAMEAQAERRDPHLRSFKEVKGYTLEATDGAIGHVDDILIDPETWRISHIVVDTHNWLPSNDVVVDSGLVLSIDWGKSQVFVNLTRDDVKESPPYDRAKAIDETYQGAVSAYYRGMATRLAAKHSPPAADLHRE